MADERQSQVAKLRELVDAGILTRDDYEAALVRLATQAPAANRPRAAREPEVATLLFGPLWVMSLLQQARTDVTRDDCATYVTTWAAERKDVPESLFRRTVIELESDFDGIWKEYWADERTIDAGLGDVTRLLSGLGQVESVMFRRHLIDLAIRLAGLGGRTLGDIRKDEPTYHALLRTLELCDLAEDEWTTIVDTDGAARLHQQWLGSTERWRHLWEPSTLITDAVKSSLDDSNARLESMLGPTGWQDLQRLIRLPGGDFTRADRRRAEVLVEQIQGQGGAAGVVFLAALNGGLGREHVTGWEYRDETVAVDRVVAQDTLTIAHTVATIWFETAERVRQDGWELDIDTAKKHDWQSIARRIIMDDRLVAKAVGVVRRSTHIDSIRYPLRRQIQA